MKIRSIRSKIIFLFAIIFGVTLSVFVAALYLVYARQSAQNFDLNLSNDALEVVGLIKGDEFLEQEIISGLTQRPFVLPFGTNKYIQVLSFDGNIIIKSANLRNFALPVGPEVLGLALSQHQVFETLDNSFSKRLNTDGKLRMVTYPVLDNGIPRYLVQVASNTAALDQSLFQFRLLLFISVPLTILLAALGGFYVAKKAFDPIDKIIRTAQSISAEHLDKRLEKGKVDDEISRLSGTLNDMFDRIEEAFNLQKQFTADASHELKTPLTILLGEIEVALKNPRTPEDYQNILESAVEEIRRITNIVDDLLTIARLESGQLPLLKQPVRIDELLLDAISRVSGYAAQHSVRVNYEVKSGSGHESEEVFVQGDRDKLLSIFINLLDNAIKYSKPNGTVKVVQKTEDKFARLEIIDTGIGIPSSDLPHVFDRFYRADKSRSASGTRRGSGLGLSISRFLVQAHGGSIQIESQEEEGTIVTVRLPVVRTDEIAESLEADSPG
ncbi:MAG TPA: ATP-binding protein [Candidatus Acidoferrales bacterium]|nr:ATP-binding protein [Candidatus Acidoferrales bacterium]